MGGGTAKAKIIVGVVLICCGYFVFGFGVMAGLALVEDWVYFVWAGIVIGFLGIVLCLLGWVQRRDPFSGDYRSSSPDRLKRCSHCGSHLMDDPKTCRYCGMDVK